MSVEAKCMLKKSVEDAKTRSLRTSGVHRKTDRTNVQVASGGRCGVT
jgi:hypothetical protein